jgi:RHS repeat-associated protein
MHWRNRRRVRRRASGRSFPYNLRFPGQVFDGEAGLHQNYFRDFDPAAGRYVESDPIGLKAGIDTYSYVFDAPTMLSDPSGLEAVSYLMHQTNSQTTKGCGGQCTGADRWKHTVDGACQMGDAQCAMAMQAAGLKGPHWPRERTYSLGCLASLGLGAKSAELVSIDQTLNNSPKIAKSLGASEAFASFLGDYLHRLFGWESTLVMSPMAIDELLKQCECKNGE